MHQSSVEKMTRFREDYLRRLADHPLTVYDLGSLSVSGGSYRSLFNTPPWIYHGIDLVPGENVDIVVKSPYDWREIASHSGDVLISGQAFEHIGFFWLTLLEMRRVMKPGGLLCLIAPSGGPIHRYPVDCWRFYPDGFRAVAAWGGFQVLDIYMQEGPTGFADGSDLWQDLVLIARRPERGGLVQRFKTHLLHRVCKRLVRGVPDPATGREAAGSTPP